MTTGSEVIVGVMTSINLLETSAVNEWVLSRVRDVPSPVSFINTKFISFVSS